MSIAYNIPHKEIPVGGKQDAKVTLTTHNP